jgi:hypothetical protein
MPDARYYVFKQEKTWLVVFEGRVMSRHTAKQKAIESAVGMANLMGAMHYDADVMLDDGKSPLQQVWMRMAGETGGRPERRRTRKVEPEPEPTAAGERPFARGVSP